MKDIMSVYPHEFHTSWERYRSGIDNEVRNIFGEKLPMTKEQYKNFLDHAEDIAHKTFSCWCWGIKDGVAVFEYPDYDNWSGEGYAPEDSIVERFKL